MIRSLYVGLIVTYFAVVYMILYWLSIPEYADIKAIVVNSLLGFGYLLTGGLVYIGIDRKVSATVYLCLLVFIISHFVFRLLYLIFIYADTDRSGVDIFTASIDMTLLSFIAFIPVVIGLGIIGRFLTIKFKESINIKGS
ncbi:MAG: hypothetical protein KUF77_15990 [Candidatus Thiodiazotropha sp. (ex Lucina aurantia)]|uniref:Uncharacterized protein n=1 Tax=Candidatus Thiodiazotropha taylori TaxID=2792791 RepID=A0A9E4T6X2_9GAMM|nr:hypothetical protein [Candidatus Thiodiazotropha sp. (ex Lucina pensylvanica)]MBT3023650.1 hypothetical protein [Candidatus Thiodiazotropha taylori]MBV2100835.1 hypothetical protein [Candidatus Thiodiazotropha sp. (ex Codakia orbicularis)]MBV2104526.1 hypothetical protein [Candidatus Thiodiazotropha sp. (ex Lucina aurantia)]MBV2119030.1 hypothetical protein [Candidatus Thiodiazotropha sp. (ex Lucina aurantia)]